MSLIVANDVIENVRWAHTLTDNTLDEHQYKWMSRYFGTFKFVSPKDIEGEQWNAHVYCFDSSRWAGIVDGLFERNKDLKVLYGNQRDFFVVYDAHRETKKRGYNDYTEMMTKIKEIWV